MSFSMKRLLYPTQRPTIFNGFGYNPLFAFLRPREFMLPISLFRTWGPDLVPGIRGGRVGFVVPVPSLIQGVTVREHAFWDIGRDMSLVESRPIQWARVFHLSWARGVKASQLKDPVCTGLEGN